MDILVLLFEIIGTVSFAISGALIAMQKKMDLLGVVFMGFTTAVGGGVIRDVLLGQIPPKIFLNPTYPIVAIITALIVFCVFKKNVSGGNALSHATVLLMMDSVGLAVFTVVGIEASQALYGFNPLLNLFMGVLTAVGGGVMRDTFSCQIPYVFTKHFYATSSIIGAVVYLVLYYLVNPFVGGIVGMLCVFALRMAASKYLWNLPKAED